MVDCSHGRVGDGGDDQAAVDDGAREVENGAEAEVDDHVPVVDAGQDDDGHEPAPGPVTAEVR